MPRLHSPSLLALALAGGLAHGLVAGDADPTLARMRDPHFSAVATLIDREMRLPASRIKEDFVKAGYPDDAWHRKALDWFYADRFKSLSADAKQAAELQALADGLRAELDKALESGQLPEAVAQLMTGSGDPVRRMTNDIGRLVNPDLPPPRVPFNPERKALLQRQIATLCQEVQKKTAAGMAKVAANKDKEGDLIWEENAKGQAAMEQACRLRDEALGPLYRAHFVLREVATRGRDFGLDPAPVEAMYAQFFKEHTAALKEWDFTFDGLLQLKVKTATLLAEAVRQKIKGMRIEDVELEAYKVVDTDLKLYPAAARDFIVGQQLLMWDQMIRARLELGGEKNGKKALELFNDFRKRYKSDNLIRLDGPDVDKMVAVGKIHITAARAARFAKGDNTTFKTLLGEVLASRRNPMLPNASQWVQFNGVGPGTEPPKAEWDEWAEAVTTEEPAQAVAIAKALMAEAYGTADEKLARGQYLSAAIKLRGAVLGLAGPFEDQFVEHGPEVYQRYAYALNRLELPLHAALVSEEGMRAVARRIGKTNPWRNAKGEWTMPGRMVRSLCLGGYNYARNAGDQLKGPALAALTAEIGDLLTKISPEDGGKSLDWAKFVALMQQKRYLEAVEEAWRFYGKYPDEYQRSFAGVVAGLSSRMRELEKSGGAKALSALDGQVEKLKSEIAKRQGLVEKEKASPARDKVLAGLRNATQSIEIPYLFFSEKYEEVMAKLGTEFWKVPPGEEDTTVSMLGYLCQACQKTERTRVKDEKKKADPQSLLAAWPAYRSVYEIYTRQLTRLKDPEQLGKARRSGTSLADVFSVTSQLADALKARSDAPAGLDEVSQLSKRWMADLVEPSLDAGSRFELVLGIAGTLWQIEEHARAVRLYALVVAKLEADADLQAFAQDPKADLDKIESVVTERPELKDDWVRKPGGLRDLIEDSPSLKKQIEDQVPSEQWGELARDFGRAKADLAKLRRKLEELKPRWPEGYARAAEALDRLARLIDQSIIHEVVLSRLALGYREQGESDKARELYDRLYDRDPQNGEYSSMFVEIVVDQLKGVGGPPPPKSDLEKALRIAMGNIDRALAEKNQVLEWTSWIQTFELWAGIGGPENLRTINDKLQYFSINRSGPNADLVAARIVPDARQSGDDPRLRRARNRMAVDLARRFLRIYELPGVTQKPQYRIEEVAVGEGTVTIFADREAPRFEAQEVETEDGRMVTVLVEEGKSAVIEAPPAGASASAATPVSATAGQSK